MSDEDTSDKESEHGCLTTSRKCLSFEFTGNDKCTQMRPLGAAHSFTGLNEIRDDSLNIQNVASRLIALDIDEIKSPRICPCGCLLRPKKVGPFRTRELSTLTLHVEPPEILQHHGQTYQPNEIAMFWKKDCRMFLWKGKAKKTL